MSYYKPPDDDERDPVRVSMRALRMNIGIGAGLMFCLALAAIPASANDERRPWASGMVFGFLIAATVIGGLIGASLTLKDFVAARQARGQRVGCMLKLLFGARLVSVFAWAVIITFGTTIVVAMVDWLSR